ncbi:MAG: MtnX-like HAD-IB family phosphatase [Humidesulfovibrio sp.]|nr:MtnX-like HAD-IB family phosphatase [Humidesulfovibrio sp.]
MRTRSQVFCDFDGTISRRDVTDTLLEAFALPEWRLIEAQWRAGEMGSRECMRRQVELLRCSRKELDGLLDAVAIDPGFPDFVAACREAGFPVIVLSDGLDYAIHRVLRNNGLDNLPVYANRLRLRPDGGYGLDSPHADPACPSENGTCKCALMRQLARPGFEAVLVGDGASDFCAASEAADFVLAKQSLLAHCCENALPHAPYTTFRDVKKLLIDLERDASVPDERASIPLMTGYPHHG